MMITMQVRVATDGVLDSVRRQLEQLPQEAFKVFRDTTPIRTGNARRRTRLTGTTIRADYPYAQRLDQGWSDQAPEGMTLPTQQWLDRRVQQIRGK